MLLAAYPELGLNIINTGVNGNTTADLLARWEKACLNHRPDILSILIGVNDVWRSFGTNEDLMLAVDLADFEENYRSILTQARDMYSPRLILMEPFMFCDDRENPMFVRLKGYINTVNRLAHEFDALLVPLQKQINEKIHKVTAQKWADDMVHPFTWAHAWICRRWLEATGL